MKRILEKIFQNFEERFSIVEDFNPLGLRKSLRVLVFEVLISVNYYFGILWIVHYDREDWANDNTSRAFTVFITIISAIILPLQIYSKRRVHISGKRELADKMITLMNLLSHNFLFIVGAIFLLKSKNLSFENDIEEILGLLLRYIISTVFVCEGYLRWEFLLLQYITTSSTIQFWMVSTSSSNQGEEFRGFHELLHIIHISFLIFSFILIFLIFQSRRRQYILSNLIIKTTREVEIPLCVMKKGEILYSNEALFKILKMRVNRTNKVSFKDLEYLKFDRFIKLREPNPLKILTRGPRKAATVIVKEHLDFASCLEILKRAPDDELTLYTSIKAESSLSEEVSVLCSEEDKEFKSSINLPLDSILEKKNEEWRQYEVKISYLDWDRYKGYYTVIKFTDFTDAQVSLESEKQREFKINILNCFSHELKTPLNISNNMIKFAIDDESVPETVKKKYLVVAQTSMEKMIYLIYDIVDFLKVETDQLICEASKFNVVQEVEEAVVLVSEHGQEKNIIIDIKAEKGKDYFIMTDRSRLKRIIINILTFIIKTNDSINLNINLRQLDADYFEIEINKALKGKGDLIDSLSSRSGRKSEEVLIYDFGLSVSKILAKIMLDYGVKHFVFHEEEEEGVIFSIKFCLANEDLEPDSRSWKISVPLEIEENMNTPSKKEKTRFTPLSMTQTKNNNMIRYKRPKPKQLCPRAMIVDDDIFNLMSLEIILGKLGVSVLKTSSGIDAVEQLKEFPKTHKCENRNCRGIEFVILDIMMPIMNGLECGSILIKLMDQGELPKFALFACSANDSKEIITECKQIGFVDFINKPISVNALKSKLKSVLRG